MPSNRPLLTLIASAGALAAAAALAVPTAGARAAFDGNACGTLSTGQLKAVGVGGKACHALPTKTASIGALGSLTGSVAYWGGIVPPRPGMKQHFLFVAVFKASNPGAVIAYLKNNKTYFLHQLGMTGSQTSATAGAGGRWFLAGGPYGCYVALTDQGTSKAQLKGLLNELEAAVKAKV